MVTCVTHSEIPSFKVKIKCPLWLLIGYSLVTRWLLVTIKHSQALLLNKSSVLHRMKLSIRTFFSQFRKAHNLGIRTVKNAICVSNIFF